MDCSVAGAKAAGTQLHGAELQYFKPTITRDAQVSFVHDKIECNAMHRIKLQLSISRPLDASIALESKILQPGGRDFPQQSRYFMLSGEFCAIFICTRLVTIRPCGSGSAKVAPV